MESISQQFEQALALHQEGQLARARVLYEGILELQPRHFDALHLSGLIAAQTGNPQRAVELIGQALAITQSAAAYNNLGLALQDLGQFDRALGCFDRAVRLQSDYAEAWLNRGVVLKNLKRWEEALASYDRAIAINRRYAEAYFNRGNLLKDGKRWEAALASYDEAIAIAPGLAAAYANRATVLHALKRFEAALASYDRAIALKPDHAEAYSNRGVSLHKLKRLDAALASYDRAIRLQPDYAEAHFNRANLLKELRRFEPSLECYDRAISLRAGYVEAHCNRGVLLCDMKQHEAALDAFDHAITLDTGSAEVHFNRGAVLRNLKRHAAALASYERVMALEPDFKFLRGIRLHLKMEMCDWVGIDADIRELARRIESQEAVCPPFPLLAMSGSSHLQRQAAEICVRLEFPANALPPPLPRHRHEKIKIGYFSADYTNHPVATLTVELIERHDRSLFEVVAFSLGADARNDMRMRLEAAFDRFLDLHEKSDREIVEIARGMELDIAIDLGGFTEGARPGIFAMRAAPLQVSYLGYLGTMGAPYMDYLIADPVVLPVEQHSHYAEKILYVPSYQPNDSKRRIADHRMAREDLDLPSTGFVFCCFNNNFKITPDTFDRWMRILARVDRSVLFLYAGSEAVVANLRIEAVKRGMDGARLVFGRRLPPAEYLARYRAADLFLDTLPYNAGTTASDALWAGLPVLTCIGQTFAGRVAASVLTALDVPELITSTPQQYENLAVELATNPLRLNEIREKVAAHRLTKPLFDTRLFTRNLEKAYERMYSRYQQDLSPDHIYPDPP